ncbi:MAG: hypothetical protein DSY50_00105, partial [Desulfobulbus sp.]
MPMNQQPPWGQKKKPSTPGIVLTHIDSTKVWYFRGSIDSLKTGTFHFIDTTTTYFHQNDVLFK